MKKIVEIYDELVYRIFFNSLKRRINRGVNAFLFKRQIDKYIKDTYSEKAQDAAETFFDSLEDHNKGK